jgi:hypothetical protein
MMGSIIGDKGERKVSYCLLGHGEDPELYSKEKSVKNGATDCIKYCGSGKVRAKKRLDDLAVHKSSNGQ